MATTNYAPQEVTNAEIIQTRTKSQYPGQRRNYNYVVRIDTVDVDTGEPVMRGEYRSLASDRPLSGETILTRMIDLIEGL